MMLGQGGGLEVGEKRRSLLRQTVTRVSAVWDSDMRTLMKKWIRSSPSRAWSTLWETTS